MLKWPDAAGVETALRAWAENLGQRSSAVVRVGFFGSYARGDWSVGSDLDVVIVVDHTDVPFVRRGAAWDTAGLPVPTDILVYTQIEWDRLLQSAPPRPRFLDEVRWVFVRSR